MRSLLIITWIIVGITVATVSMQGQNPPPAAGPRELTTYRDVVKRVLPAVVSIEAKTAKPTKPARPKEPADDGDLGFGSGWIVDSAGVILTNFHVVEGADELIVQTVDGRKFTTRDFRADKKSDLAIVRIQPRGPLPVLQFGDSEAMQMGDRVLAFGAPFGLRGSVTSGIISAKGRSLRLNSYEDYLQTDAAVNPGSSGGPLVNLDGQVIGIMSAIKSRSGGFQGVGLAIASNFAKSILDQLLKDGAVKRGYIGAHVDDLDPDSATRLGVRGGVVVTKVIANSPASKGGMKVGDAIVAIAGREVKDGRDMQRVVGDLKVDQAIGITVVRGGKRMALTITVADHP